MNIVLTGFMATGKTEISRRIARLLKMKLVDTDKLIEENTKMTINDIFSKHGEEYFRKIEKQVVLDASKLDNTVISTGGGVVLNEENIENLRNNGIVVNLSPEFSVIQERIEAAAKTRPLMKGKSIDEIKSNFDYRKKFYDNCDIKINVTNSKTPLEHAEEIVDKVNEFIKDR